MLKINLLTLVSVVTAKGLYPFPGKECTFGQGKIQNFAGKEVNLPKNTWMHLLMADDCSFSVRGKTDNHGHLVELSAQYLTNKANALHKFKKGNEVHAYEMGAPWWECIGNKQHLKFGIMKNSPKSGKDESDWRVDHGNIECYLEEGENARVKLVCTESTLSQTRFGGLCGTSDICLADVIPNAVSQSWKNYKTPLNYQFKCPATRYACDAPPPAPATPAPVTPAPATPATPAPATLAPVSYDKTVKEGDQCPKQTPYGWTKVIPCDADCAYSCEVSNLCDPNSDYCPTGTIFCECTAPATGSPGSGSPATGSPATGSPATGSAASGSTSDSSDDDSFNAGSDNTTGESDDYATATPTESGASSLASCFAVLMVSMLVSFLC